MDRPLPKAGDLFTHFKGNVYRVIDIGHHTETGEQFVVRKRLDEDADPKTYIRPLDMFMSEVDHEKYPDVEQKYRFKLGGHLMYIGFAYILYI